METDSGNCCCCCSKARSGFFDIEYGVHRPCCYGFCLRAHTGSDNMSLLSILLITVPCGFYFGFMLNDQINELTLAAPVAIGVLMLLCLIYLFLAMFTEPGILPAVTYEDPRAPRLKSYIVLQGNKYELRDFRAKFSKFTDNCIENFDHYCPWVGNAVGRRNYKYFVFFVLFVFLLSVTMCGTCTTTVVLKAMKIDGSTSNTSPVLLAFQQNVCAVVLALYSFAMIVSLGSLLAFHFWAISKNQTTNEILKGAYTEVENPHDQGCVKNYCDFLCFPLYRSRIVKQTSHSANSPLLNASPGFPSPIVNILDTPSSTVIGSVSNRSDAISMKVNVPIPQPRKKRLVSTSAPAQSGHKIRMDSFVGSGSQEGP